MKRRIWILAAAAALLMLCTACGGTPSEQPSSGSGTSENGGTPADDDGAIKKEDCNTVYAEIISVNGDQLTVSAGDQVLALTVDTDLLLDWKEEESVILYFTGEFGDEMQVHYIDKWTENSEVQPPEGTGKDAQAEKGGSVVG